MPNLCRVLANSGLACGVALGIFLLARANAVAAPEPSDAAIVHVLDRLGYGPRPHDVARVRAMGLRPWIEQQLHPDRIPDRDVQRRLAGLRSLDMSARQLALTYPYPGQVKRLKDMARRGNRFAQRFVSELPPRARRGRPQDILMELSAARLLRDLYSNHQLKQVMVDFWDNHFNVYFYKGADRLELSSFERNVIRPHAMGRFRDLLGAVARSPAMLYYLDNWRSTARRKGGVNENYGRELMELHTLGVNGGYTQRDVVEVARCFTGWTVDRPDFGGGFVFRPGMHDDGPKTVLGHHIPAGGGESDGDAVLDILARDPHTADHLSFELCRRFVADAPPPSLVRRVAAVYMETDGNIRAMLRTIFLSPEFNAPANDGAKVKTPLEFTMSAMRAVNAQTLDARPVLWVLQRMGMSPYLCLPPTGYPDQAVDWLSTDGMLERMSFATALMGGRVRGTVVQPVRLLSAFSLDPDTMVSQMSAALLGVRVEATTRAVLREAVVRVEEGRATFPQIIALLLGSPEFQRR